LEKNIGIEFEALDEEKYELAELIKEQMQKYR